MKHIKSSEQEILQDAIDTFGVVSQVDMMIEEMSELIQALLKLKRKGGFVRLDQRNLKEWVNTIEEIADVSIVLDQMYILFDKEEIMLHRASKVARLKERISWAKPLFTDKNTSE